VMPGPEVARTDHFQLRGLPIGESRWLGVLTDEEAAALQADPVIPGRDPNEPRGALYDFYEAQHVPTELYGPAARPYRLWGAKVAKVSAAPRDWPKDFPDKWGTRDTFSDYQVLPEAPAFLRAGLLGDGRSKYPFWVRDPDGVLVLHHDKLGPTGRLHVTRVSGPVGKVAWDAALQIENTDAVLFAPDPSTTTSIVFVGTEPNPTHDPQSEVSREAHQKIVALNVASGAVATYDLTARSVMGSAVVD